MRPPTVADHLTITSYCHHARNTSHFVFLLQIALNIPSSFCLGRHEPPTEGLRARITDHLPPTVAEQLTVTRDCDHVWDPSHFFLKLLWVSPLYSVVASMSHMRKVLVPMVMISDLPLQKINRPMPVTVIMIQIPVTSQIAVIFPSILSWLQWTTCGRSLFLRHWSPTSRCDWSLDRHPWLRSHLEFQSLCICSASHCEAYFEIQTYEINLLPCLMEGCSKRTKRRCKLENLSYLHIKLLKCTILKYFFGFLAPPDFSTRTFPNWLRAELPTSPRDSPSCRSRAPPARSRCSQTRPRWARPLWSVPDKNGKLTALLIVTCDCFINESLTRW